MPAPDARAAGIQWTFTPMVDIARDARWGRIVEGAGEDPYLGAAMARAQVRGFQGATLGPDSVLACVKHFAGYGAAEGGRDYDSSYIPEVLFPQRLPGAVPCRGAGGRGQLHERLHGPERCAGHRQSLAAHRHSAQGVGLQGLRGLGCVRRGEPGDARLRRDPADAAYKAISAGLNMDMASQTYTHNLAKLVADGKVSEAQLDKAVLPILELKYEIGPVRSSVRGRVEGRRDV